MAKKIEINIDGKRYPCRMTMGALLRFKRETGKELTSITADSGSDSIVLMWCCAVSACKHDDIEFGYTLEDFADAVTPPVLNAWSNAVAADMTEADEEDSEKKR